MKRLIFVLFFTGALVSCGGSSSSSVTYKTAAELIAGLKDAGLTCTGYTPTPKEDRELIQEDAREAGECELDGESLDITIWKDAGQRRQWEGLGKTMGCSMGEAFGITEFDYLNGGTWTISGMSQTLTEELASKFDGDAIHVDC
jgi:hypothetical protein